MQNRMQLENDALLAKAIDGLLIKLHSERRLGRFRELMGVFDEPHRALIHEIGIPGEPKILQPHRAVFCYIEAHHPDLYGWVQEKSFEYRSGIKDKSSQRI